MVDYFHISIKVDDLLPIGKQIQVLQPGSGHTSSSFTEVNVSPHIRAPQFKVQMKAREKRIDFKGCPALWLQGHNGMGSNDLQFMVAESVALVFARLKRKVPAAVVGALSTGSYRVHEAHIAEIHKMEHPLIGDFCNDIRKHAPDDLQAVPLERGIGIRLWPNSRDRQVLLYDKHHYFRDGAINHKKRLLGMLKERSWERLGPCLHFDQMMEYLQKGIRIETRHKGNLKRYGLDVGSAWTTEAARKLHLDVLETVPLMDYVVYPPAIHSIKRLTALDRTRLVVWHYGQPIRKYFDSPASYFRWREHILKLTSWDVSKSPVPCGNVAWDTLIHDRSILLPPPWAIEENFIYEKPAEFPPRSLAAWPIAKFSSKAAQL